MDEAMTTQFRSEDGSGVMAWRRGDGRPLVLVGGGLDDGSENEPLAEALQGAFSVTNYRRRGRGDDAPATTFSLEGELEDLDAVLRWAGDGALLFGVSSGGALALEAAAAGLPVEGVAVYDVPYAVPDPSFWLEYRDALAVALAGDDRAEALRLFMRLAGSSEESIAAATASPMWEALLDLAPTLAADAAALGDGVPPKERLRRIDRPTLVLTGVMLDPAMAGLAPEFFGDAADAVAAAIPGAVRRKIESASHVPEPALIAPVITEFFRAEV